MPLARRLSIIDVGHGNSAVLVDDNGVVVIDTGPNNTLLEFLDQEGIQHVNTVLISHADTDHIRGLLALIASEAVSIDKVYLNSDAQQNSVLWDELLYTLDYAHRTKKIRLFTSLHNGLEDDLSCGRIKIEVLAPSPYLSAKGPGGRDRENNLLTTNTLSAVILLSNDEKPLALLPGDIDSIGLHHLLLTGVPATKIVVFPHHGGRPGRFVDPISFAEQFVKAFQPEVVLFSNGRGGSDNPRPDIVSTIKAVLPDVHIACTQLSAVCEKLIKLNNAAFLTSAHAKGKNRGICCAGTLHIDLDDSNDLHPMSSHQQFVSNHVSSPLCRSKSTVQTPPDDLFAGSGEIPIGL